jgi:hypothetical protein
MNIREMKYYASPDPSRNEMSLQVPNPSDFVEQASMQPYYKSHGSSNWLDSDSGSGKRYPVLEWYHAEFKRHLSKPNA